MRWLQRLLAESWSDSSEDEAVPAVPMQTEALLLALREQLCTGRDARTFSAE
jgi:hypothetical protein